jgi:hypothetical protein
VHASTGSLRTRSFGVFEVDLRVAELRKFGIKIKLQEQPFQLLALLLTHPGELHTRDELRQALGPEHTFVDFDRASQAFEKTKTERGAVMADLLQVKALAMAGSPTEARLLIDQSIRIAQTSHDRELKLSARVIAARFQGASKNPVDLNQAVGGLEVVFVEATAGSVEAVAFKARLALGQIELNPRNQSSGRAHQATLQREAYRRRFQLVARKAAAALHVAHNQASGQRPSQNKNRGLSRSTRA